MKPYDFAQMTDISVVRSHHCLDDVRKVAEIALTYRFRNVHALPGYVAELAKLIGEQPDVFVGAPVGFPSGGTCTGIKCREAQQLIEDGAREIDIVMNVGRFKDKNYDFVLNELRQVIAVCGKMASTKVIVEMNLLSDVELVEACRIVRASGADYLKTGTGWIPAPLNLIRVKQLKKTLGSELKLKVAGGIRTLDEIRAMTDMGVERFGMNDKTAVEIIRLMEQTS